ncbi:DUF1289 domain-containing protein [Methylophaga sp. SB9B]|uniref:DUF1289 domain-containing protein n=1 Tax=Methylophaga sp. SB9B TaxID=2570356 RepID=UPI001FFE78EB|nr:DUF1289 domain-containing protein [Methylophaga sp. SB9B]
MSPCIDICEFVGPNGWCTGCGRTREECQQWKKLKPYSKNLLQNSLKKRMSQMKVDKK